MKEMMDSYSSYMAVLARGCRVETEREVWLIRNRETIISSCRDERFEEDHGVGFFLLNEVW